MKITRIVAIPFNLPLAQPVTFAAGKLSVNENVLIEIHTDEGLVGRAEAPSRPFFYGESQESMVAAIARWFAPLLEGADPFNIERVWAGFASVEHNNTPARELLHGLLSANGYRRKWEAFTAFDDWYVRT